MYHDAEKPTTPLRTETIHGARHGDSPIILALRKLKQEDYCKPEAKLGCIINSKPGLATE